MSSCARSPARNETERSRTPCGTAHAPECSDCGSGQTGWLRQRMPTARAVAVDGSIAGRDDRLRMPIIICDECQILRPLNGRGTELFEAEKLTGDLLSARPSHPFVRGLSNVAIGRQIGISPETVKTHVRSIFAKSGTHSRAEFL